MTFLLFYFIHEIHNFALMFVTSLIGGLRACVCVLERCGAGGGQLYKIFIANVLVLLVLTGLTDKNET